VRFEDTSEPVRFKDVSPVDWAWLLVRVTVLGSRVKVLGCRVKVLGCRVNVLGSNALLLLRVKVLGFRASLFVLSDVLGRDEPLLALFSFPFFFSFSMIS